MNTSEVELLPCPFCGSQAILEPKRFGYVPSIECANKLCGAWIKGETGYRVWSNEETIKAWNTRKTPQPELVDPVKPEQSLEPLDEEKK